jgi:hypothetical protein
LPCRARSRTARSGSWAERAEAARIYDLRSTFASNALAAGVAIVELARIMGTSVRMIERHYGALRDGARSAMADRLDALEAELERVARRGEGGRWCRRVGAGERSERR